MEGKICTNKNCSHQGAIQPYDNFVRDSSSVDGRASRCKTCKHISDKEYDKTKEGRYRNCKARAKLIKKDFDLTLDQFNEITLQACYYCGQFREGKNNVGIDRINSDLGYVIGNVRSCCAWCNQAKLDRTEEEFKDHIKLVYENFIDKKQKQQHIEIKSFIISFLLVCFVVSVFSMIMSVF